MTINIKPFIHKPFDITTYLVWKDGETEAMMVNIGRDIDPIVAFCEENNLALDHILHTHGFLEHLEGQPPLRDHFDLTAYMSPLDEFWIAHLDTQATILGVEAPPMAFVEQQINSGEVLQIGGIEVQVIHTPGNSPGGMCFYMPELQAVFTGDVCYAGCIGATDVPHGDEAQLQNSIKTKLFTLPDETRIFPGRGPSTTVEAEKTNNKLECALYGKPLPETASTTS